MQILFKLIMLSLVIFITNIYNLSAQKHNVNLQQIDKLAQFKVNQKKTAGIQIGVLQDGKVIYNKSFGYLGYYNLGKLLGKPEKLGNNNIFDLASLTKIVATTQAIMMLVDDGRIQLNDKVAQYIPAFAVNNKGNITIYDLLTHTSGLPAWYPLYLHNKDALESILYISSLALAYDTGTKTLYSDLGFIILGEIISRVVHMPLDVYTQRYIFAPLNMQDTQYNLPQSLQSRAVFTSWGNLLEQYLINNKIMYHGKSTAEDFKNWRNYTLQGEVEDGNAYYAMAGVSGHAGLFSTMNDMLILGKLFLNAGSYDGATLYSPSTFLTFTTVQATGRALGFDYDKSYMGNHRPIETLGHTGFTGNCIAFNSQSKIMVIILSNKVNIPMDNFRYTGAQELCADIMDVVWDNTILNDNETAQ